MKLAHLERRSVVNWAAIESDGAVLTRAGVAGKSVQWALSLFLKKTATAGS